MCRALEERGIGCWAAFRDVREGRDYGDEILRGIGESSVLVLLLSGQSNLSEHVKNEVERAVTNRKRLVTVRIQDVRPEGSLQLHLARSQWVNAFAGRFEDHLARLPRIVKNPGKSDRPPNPTLWDILRPYRRPIGAIVFVVVFVLGMMLLQAVLDPPTNPDLVKRPTGSPWLFPNSSERRLTDDDLKYLTRVGLFWARNEIFARHGYIFATPNGKSYAASLGTNYVGTEDNQEKVYSALSPLERENIHVIRGVESFRGFPFAILHPGNFRFYWHQIFG
jgi:hypothetical protein